MPTNSMYNDAQWSWLFDRFIEGYSMTELADFAGCGTANLVHHWRRLGFRSWKSERKPLNRKEFNALVRCSDG